MKVGDLIIARELQGCMKDPDCFCFFCENDSSRVGLVLREIGPRVKHSEGYWLAMFDVGEWRLYGTEAEVISER